MVDKIKKYLARIPQKERDVLDPVFDQILNVDDKRLDIKRLRGFSNLYRVRVGSSRIVFQDNNSERRILFVGKRDENTYKNFKK